MSNKIKTIVKNTVEHTFEQLYYDTIENRPMQAVIQIVDDSIDSITIMKPATINNWSSSDILHINNLEHLITTYNIIAQAIEFLQNLPTTQSDS